MSQPAGNRLRDTRPGLRRQPHQQPGNGATRRRRSLLQETAGILVTAVVVSLIIKTVLVQAFFIPSGSMEPTLHGCPGCLGDRVLVNKLTNHIGGVHRGDIVVFRDPGGWLGHGFSAPEPQSGVYTVLAFIGLSASSSD